MRHPAYALGKKTISGWKSVIGLSYHRWPVPTPQLARLGSALRQQVQGHADDMNL